MPYARYILVQVVCDLEYETLFVNSPLKASLFNVVFFLNVF